MKYLFAELGGAGCLHAFFLFPSSLFLHTYANTLSWAAGFCIHNQDGHLQPRPKMWAASGILLVLLQTHTGMCTHLHIYIPLALCGKCAVPWRNKGHCSGKGWLEKNRKRDKVPPPLLLSSAYSSSLFSLAGWVIYIELDPILAAAVGDSASPGQPMHPPCTIFSNRTASNSSTELFSSLCFAPSAAAAPAKGTCCVYVCAQICVWILK